MTDRPILFSAPMVLALLAGRKTQTRRIVMSAEEIAKGPWTGGVRQIEPGYWQVRSATYNAWKRIPVRYGVGDRLWVREAWRQGYAPTSFSDGIIYRADAPKASGMDEYSPRHKWKPGIHMFRRHSRLTLYVTDVRVQRLQEISETDAIAEGLEHVGDGHRTDRWRIATSKATHTCLFARDAYHALWEDINGTGSWDANPWVAAYSFTVEHTNIDAARMPA